MPSPGVGNAPGKSADVESCSISVSFECVCGWKSEQKVGEKKKEKRDSLLLQVWQKQIRQ